MKNREEIPKKDRVYPIIQLPNGDMWSPRNLDGVDTQNVQSPPAKSMRTQAEKLKEAVEEGGSSCPWCDLPFEGKISLQQHILSQHGSIVTGDEELENASLRAQAQRKVAK